MPASKSPAKPRAQHARPRARNAPLGAARPQRDALLSRLNRIGGQVRGVAGMIERERYCVEVLTQIAAIRSALDAVAMRLLEDHARGCVGSAIRAGRGEESIEELMSVVKRLSR